MGWDGKREMQQQSRAVEQIYTLGELERERVGGSTLNERSRERDNLDACERENGREKDAKSDNRKRDHEISREDICI